MINSDFLETFFWIFLLLAIVIGTLVTKYLKKRRGVSQPGASVLLTYYSDGAGLLPLDEGNIGDMHFSTIITNDAKILLYRVELPFSSKVHLLGIPKIEGVVQLNPSKGKTLMTAVDLEGDFGNYFTLFTEKGQQLQARYVLDPKAMIFTVDFCKSHNWELINNELYFLQDLSVKTDDPTIMYDDIAKFVAEVRPAVEIPLTDKEIRDATPYGEDRRDDLKCPICSKVMTNTNDYFSCPSGHGILINGKNLMQLSDGKLHLEQKIDPNKSQDHRSLICPSCGYEMQHVAYDGGKENIDSCENCIYRWLDAAEIDKIIKSG